MEKNLIYLGNSLSELVQLKTLVFGTRFCNGKDRSLDEGDGFLCAGKLLGNSLENLVELKSLTFGNDFNIVVCQI